MSVLMRLLSALSLLALAFAATTPEGKAFLEMNKAKEGVVETPSGLQYKVIKSGAEGGKSPKVNTPCLCHYKGETIDGDEFDSSFKRGKPTTFAPNQSISGEMKGLVVSGDLWATVKDDGFIYESGRFGSYNIDRYSKSNTLLGPALGGLMYLVCSGGSNEDQVIKGWTEAMQMMKEGDYWQLVIPSELAYGDSQRGQFITPGAVLVFELELIEVKGPGVVKAEL